MTDKIARPLCLIFSLAAAGEPKGVWANAQEGARSSLVREAISAEKDHQNSEVVAAVHRLVNDLRREQGLKPLTLNPLISAAAREHSADMARSGGISHGGFERRLQEIRKKLPYTAAAENVASIGYDDPARTVVEGWAKSPGHRRNMLGDFSLTGIGIAKSKDGRYFFTQIFIQPPE